MHRKNAGLAPAFFVEASAWYQVFPRIEMNYADSQFVKLARSGMWAIKPQFSELVAVDYYDGIETGFGCCANGEIVRINSLADSNSRLFRAFEFAVVDGNWIEKVSRLTSKSYEYAQQMWS